MDENDLYRGMYSEQERVQKQIRTVQIWNSNVFVLRDGLKALAVRLTEAERKEVEHYCIEAKTVSSAVATEDKRAFERQYVLDRITCHHQSSNHLVRLCLCRRGLQKRGRSGTKAEEISCEYQRGRPLVGKPYFLTSCHLLSVH